MLHLRKTTYQSEPFHLDRSDTVADFVSIPPDFMCKLEVNHPIMDGNCNRNVFSYVSLMKTSNARDGFRINIFFLLKTFNRIIYNLTHHCGTKHANEMMNDGIEKNDTLYMNFLA